MIPRSRPEARSVPCRLCNGLAEPTDDHAATHYGYPDDAIDKVYNARTFAQDGYALVHHDCSSPAASNNDTPYWIVEVNWWACSDLDRPLDSGVVFDLHCHACAQRWQNDQALLHVFGLIRRQIN